MDSFRYRLVISGRMSGETRQDAESRVRDGLTFNLALHESIDELTIQVEPSDFERLRGMQP